MDELLVSWLSSDSVYEECVTWIDQYATAPSQPEGATTTAPQTQNATAHPDDETERLSSDKSHQAAAAQPREEAPVVIPTPPFYPGRLQQKPAQSDDPEGNAPPAAGEGVSPLSDTSRQRQQQETTGQNNIRQQLQALWTDVVGAGQKNAADPEQAWTLEDFVHVTTRSVHLPSFFNRLLYQRILSLAARDVEGSEEEDNTDPDPDQEEGQRRDSTMATRAPTVVTSDLFLQYYDRYLAPLDDVDTFFTVLVNDAVFADPTADDAHLVRDDFLPVLQALLQEHPGLEFLSTHSECTCIIYDATVYSRLCVN